MIVLCHSLLCVHMSESVCVAVRMCESVYVCMNSVCVQLVFCWLAPEFVFDCLM